jgi:hypothetical protein
MKHMKHMKKSTEKIFMIFMSFMVKCSFNRHRKERHVISFSATAERGKALTRNLTVEIAVFSFVYFYGLPGRSQTL